MTVRAIGILFLTGITIASAEAVGFTDRMQEIVAADMRIATNAARACGFVIDADRLKLRLVEDDISYSDLMTRTYSGNSQSRISADAIEAEHPSKVYCDKAWSEFGPSAPVGDDVFYKCRSRDSCP